MEIEDYLGKPYWVIDILPKQVPANSRGQYFEIEKYYLEHPQLDIIYKKFTDILLKLNCYENMDFSSDGENWNTNPLPQEIKAAMMQCMADKQMLYIDMKSIDVMIIVRQRSSMRTQPLISCPSVSGVASCKCVRPILTSPMYFSDFALRQACIFSRAGRTPFSTARTAAMCSAVGKVSLT